MSNINNITNITNIIDCFDLYQEPQRFWLKSGIITISIIIQVLGNALCACIIAYEKYGGDPQKRTILNQLFSMLTGNVIVLNLVPLNTLILRVLTSPLPSYVVNILFFIPKVSVGFNSLLILNEMLLLRFLSVFYWKRIPPINDNLLFVTLNMANGLISVLLACLVNMGYNIEHEMSFALTGVKTDHNPDDLPIFR